ncbi:thyrotropin-releasing hormone receptor [Plakobranchus ocellatus]|uniref:Thyrotropin-releasing hormone receptor n=1 Tax=Plakobranchus ocellatus TaxID=259542 RepID=A0AAV4DY50_9GAST|nr:thyrotropin-releasing hormone receptor [Plakobranchus ocellatus]
MLSSNSTGLLELLDSPFTASPIEVLEDGAANEEKTYGDVFIASEAIISTKALEIIENLVDVFLISLLALLGIVTNILDLAVFTRQGFRDSVNISLAAIAVWDLIKCVCGITIRIYGPLGWHSRAYRYTWKSLTTPTLVFANYVSYVLAAYVSFERCLCVTIPFKVKSIVTPKLTFIMMIIISVVVIASFGVIFFIYDITWVYSTHFNATVAVFQFNSFHKNHGPVVIAYFNLIGIVNPIFCFIVIVTCTLIIVYQLNKMSRFRAAATASAPANKSQTATDTPTAAAGPTSTSGANTAPGNTLSSRDRQVVKMLVVVIIVYIVALLPRFAHYAGKFLEPDFAYLRRYHNMFTLSSYIVLLFDYINASVNLFIYLTMSTNFRATFYQMFPACGKKTVGNGT